MTIITCVSNEEGFAKSVYDHLYAELERQKQFDKSRNIVVTPDLIKLLPDSNEIQIDGNVNASKGLIKWILESYLKTNPVKFKDYGVIEFGDTFTIGKILHPSQMEMLTCEICGFFTPYVEELHTHRMTHFGI